MITAPIPPAFSAVAPVISSTPSIDVVAALGFLDEMAATMTALGEVLTLLAPLGHDDLIHARNLFLGSVHALEEAMVSLGKRRVEESTDEEE